MAGTKHGYELYKGLHLELSNNNTGYKNVNMDLRGVKGPKYDFHIPENWHKRPGAANISKGYGGKPRQRSKTYETALEAAYHYALLDQQTKEPTTDRTNENTADNLLMPPPSVVPLARARLPTPSGEVEVDAVRADTASAAGSIVSLGSSAVQAVVPPPSGDDASAIRGVASSSRATSRGGKRPANDLSVAAASKRPKASGGTAGGSVTLSLACDTGFGLLSPGEVRAGDRVQELGPAHQYMSATVEDIVDGGRKAVLQYDDLEDLDLEDRTVELALLRRVPPVAGHLEALAEEQTLALLGSVAPVPASMLLPHPGDEVEIFWDDPDNGEYGDTAGWWLTEVVSIDEAQRTLTLKYDDHHVHTDVPMSRVRPRWLWSAGAGSGGLFVCRLRGRLLQPLAVAVQRAQLQREVDRLAREVDTAKSVQGRATAEREGAESEMGRVRQEAATAREDADAAIAARTAAYEAINQAQAGVREVPVGEHELFKQRHAIYAQCEAIHRQKLQDEAAATARQATADRQVQDASRSYELARAAEMQAADATAAKIGERDEARSRSAECDDLMAKLAALAPAMAPAPRVS